MAFEATVRRWGNALGVTLPKEVTKKLGIGPETRVEVEVRPVVPRLWGIWKDAGLTYAEALRELERMEEEEEEAEREHEKLYDEILRHQRPLRPRHR